jgi:glycerol-3-phosphate dehydrogenase
MALKVEDVLSRRMRVLILDAKAAIAMAPMVAEIMAKELPNGDKDIMRARQKVVATAISLSKQMQIKL